MTDALKARRYAEALVAGGGVLVLSPVIYDAIKAASDDPMPDGLIRQGLLPVAPANPTPPPGWRTKTPHHPIPAPRTPKKGAM